MYSRKFQVVFILTIIQAILSTSTNAAVQLPWSTTYNCPDWTQGQSFLSCNGLTKNGDWTTADGSREQITAAANYPGGGGGKGQRHWIGDGNGGVNDNSGSTLITFSTAPTEYWVRWYMRFQKGFTWANYQGFKVLYFLQPNTSTIANYFMTAFWNDGMSYYENFGGQNHHRCENCGFKDIHKDPTDSAWHCYEVHLKHETGAGNDGVVQVWIDGALKINASNVRHGPKFGGFIIASNAKYFPVGKSDMYVDFDDFVVTHQRPSNRDAQGNNMVGCIGSSILSPPTNLKILQ